MIAEAGEGFAHNGRIRRVTASQARPWAWVCRAYVHMVCRLLGILNRGEIYGSTISRTSAGEGMGRRVTEGEGVSVKV